MRKPWNAPHMEWEKVSRPSSKEFIEEEEDERSAKEPLQNNGIPPTATATFTSVNPG